VLPEVRRAFAAHRNLVLVAPPGAGKTTRVPPLLLEAPDLGRQQVVMLQPRRVAARASAARIAHERGTALGEEVGFQVRFERRAGPRTRLLVVTEGILLRRLEADPLLEGIGALVLDELHERSLDLDLSLALARRVQQEARPDLRIVVMSATLDPAPVARFLGDAPVVASEGRTFPVEVRYRPPPGPRDWDDTLARAVEEALGAQPGDVLAFLPGWAEIRRAEAALRARGALGNLGNIGVEVLPLHGDLSPEEQDRALVPGARRRVIVSTNVAETSLTIERVGAVVDLGLARVLEHDPASGLNRLELRRISRASAEQRAGRAGRTGPGLALRLWSEPEQRGLEAFTPPEVERLELSGAALALLAFGETDLAHFPWFAPPPPATLATALGLLERLGATAEGRLTALGREMAGLPLHPRLARLVVEGRRLGVPRRAALAAALLAERDPLRGDAGGQLSRRGLESDVLVRVEALERERVGPEVDRGAAAAIWRARDQLAGDARDRLAGGEADDALLRSLLAGYPDRVALRRAKGSPEAVMIGGRGVKLARESAVRDAEWFLVLDGSGARGIERSQALVRSASALDPAWLDPTRMVTRVEASFDATKERVVARQVTRYEDLVVRDVETGQVDAEQAAATLAQAAAADPARALGLDRPEEGQWLARLASLAAWMPELGLPAGDDAWVRSTLPLLCVGKRSFADLGKAAHHAVWERLLTHAQRQALDRHAPERLAVPSGSHIRLVYASGKPPVLAARIQELFGLAATPKVAGGRVNVLLHMLAPSGRPQQVTDDLTSFWNTGYLQVRKELRARYPRHAWPEDPWTAPAERRPKRRS
jgi:ATP-dependent helicase HrpB